MKILLLISITILAVGCGGTTFFGADESEVEELRELVRSQKKFIRALEVKYDDISNRIQNLEKVNNPIVKKLNQHSDEINQHSNEILYLKRDLRDKVDERNADNHTHLKFQILGLGL